MGDGRGGGTCVHGGVWPPRRTHPRLLVNRRHGRRRGGAWRRAVRRCQGADAIAWQETCQQCRCHCVCKDRVLGLKPAVWRLKHCSSPLCGADALGTADHDSTVNTFASTCHPQHVSPASCAPGLRQVGNIIRLPGTPLNGQCRYAARLVGRHLPCDSERDWTGDRQARVAPGASAGAQRLRWDVVGRHTVTLVFSMSKMSKIERIELLAAKYSMAAIR